MQLPQVMTGPSNCMYQECYQVTVGYVWSTAISRKFHGTMLWVIVGSWLCAYGSLNTEEGDDDVFSVLVVLECKPAVVLRWRTSQLCCVMKK